MTDRYFVCHHPKVTTEAATDGAIPILARMCVWRVFGVRHDWSDRPEGATLEIAKDVGPLAGDRTTVFIGDIPSNVVGALCDWRAQTRHWLNHLFSGTCAGKSPEECQELIGFYSTEADLADVKASFSLWVTVEVSRPLTVYARPSGRYGWIAGDAPLAALDAFGDEASEYLSFALVRLLPAVGGELQPDRLTFSDTRAYLLADGKGVIARPRSTMSGNLTAWSPGWESVSVAAMEDALASIPMGRQSLSPLLGSCSRWLWRALESENDRLRGFLFAFVGLEILTNKVGKRVRERVAEQLAVQTGNLPISELMWPKSHEGEMLDRNLLFRFTCMAIALSRETASTDVSTFRGLMHMRHALAHGQMTGSDNAFRAAECIDFLQRYLSIVAAAEASGQL